MKHVAFFGDGEKTFALPSDQILELERMTGHGIGAIYVRTMTNQFAFTEIMEVIRLGLIGGGTSPKEAADLVDAYGRVTPVIERLQLAADILEALWSGTPDLAAKISEAYADVPA